MLGSLELRWNVTNTGLLEMKQTGLIERVVEALGLDDADFAGMYGHEKPTDSACAKSHSGFVIVFAGVPVLWQSKLQTQTALSTMEAEVIALGACMKELIASCCCWDTSWRCEHESFSS